MRTLLFSVLSLLLAGNGFTASAQLVINELMQSNVDCLMDDLKEFPDSWVELYNTSSAPCSLNGYQMGVLPDASTAWTLPSGTVPAHGFQWLDYVVDCRKGKNVSTDFDAVEGGVANDNVIDTVKDYEKGIINAEQALGQLKYKKVNHQICILNQNVIDNYLKFVESFTLEIDEED